MRLISLEVQNAEIIDWWETERFYLWNECNRQNERLAAIATKTIDQLSTKDTIWIKSEARNDLKRKIASEIEMHNRRLATHLTASYERSTSRIEALSGLDGASSKEYATVAAGLAAGAGAIGLAVGASAFVPATAVLFFVIPVGTLGSWPVFAALGLGSVGAAWVSPKIGGYAKSSIKDRYKRAIQSTIYQRLLSEKEDDPHSSWMTFSLQLDAVMQARLNT